jgi:hypothetical protein
MAAAVADADGDFDLADQIRAARPPYPGTEAVESASTPEERRLAMQTLGEAIADRAMSWEQDVDAAAARARERLGLPPQPPARRERRDGLHADELDKEW